MALDNDLKIKARAYFECNTLSYKKVGEHLEEIGYEVSIKTLQAWGAKEKWVKNRYGSMKEAIEALLPKEVLDNVTDTVKEKIIQAMNEDNVAITPEIIDQQVEAVSQEVIYQTLNKHALMGKLALNLTKAEIIANNSTSMGVKATFHGMLIGTIQTVYGKKIEMTPQDPNSKVLGEKEMSQLSTQELQEMLKE